MKKRIVAMLLCAALLLPAFTPFSKADSAYGTVALKDGFLVKPEGTLPVIPDVGLLKEPEIPLAIPGENGLMTGFSGPAEDAVAISSLDELMAVTGGSYYLSCDLDASGMTEWSGITAPTKSTLIIDGQGHTISGLPAPLVTSAWNLEVRNLIVTAADGGMEATAMLADTVRANLTLDNCTAKGILRISGSALQMNFGGLVSNAYSGSASSIANCAFLGSVDLRSATSRGLYAGGIVGRYRGSISDCYVRGTVAGCSFVGGIAGELRDSAAVRRCQVLITDVLSGSYVGGISAQSAGATLNTCSVVTEAGGKIRAESTCASVSGIAIDAASVENCCFRGTFLLDVIGKPIRGIANNVSKSVSDSYAVCDFQKSETCTSSGSASICGIAGTVTGSVIDCAARLTSDVAASYYGIAEKAGGSAVRCHAAGSVPEGSRGAGISGDCSVIQDCCSTLGNVEVGIGSADRIVNCYVNGPITLSGSGIGSGSITDCAVRNVTCTGAGIGAGSAYHCLVENCTITGTTRAAGITSSGSAVDCTVTNTTISAQSASSGDVYAAGIAASSKYVSNCAVIGCTISASLTSSYAKNCYAGGIVAKSSNVYTGSPMDGSIFDCTVENTVITSENYAGGIAGFNDASTITDCITKNTDVTTTNTAFNVSGIGLGAAGGIVGQSSGPVLACQADGDVSGYYAGGIIGSTSSTGVVLQSCISSGTVTSNAYGGGLAGYFKGVAINECSSSADILASSVTYPTNGDEFKNSAMGGLVGTFFAGELTNSSADGLITCEEDNTRNFSMGGLCGKATENCAISNCSFRGNFDVIFGYAGGLVGEFHAVEDPDAIYEFYDLVITDCHVENQLTPTGDALFGGLVGVSYDQVASVILSNCTTKGFRISGSSSVGGLIYGAELARMEHCSINGDIVASFDESPVFGGFAARPLNVGRSGNCIAADCWINGDVILTASKLDESGNSYYGLHVGPLYSGCAFNCYNSGVIASASDTSYAFLVNGAEAAGPLHGTIYNDSFGYLTPDTYQFYGEENDRTLTIRVLGGHYGGAIGFPLVGAKVTAGGQTVYTDSNGVAKVPCGQDVFQGATSMTIERDGYDSVELTQMFATNKTSYTVTLWRLDPGKIAVTGGSVTLTDNKVRELSKHTVQFSQDDENSYYVNISINWNEHTPDRVYLEGESSGRTVELTTSEYGASGYVCFGSSFEAEEKIYIRAITEESPQYGILTAHYLTGWKVKPLDIKIHVEVPGDGETMTQNEEETGDFFLENSTIKVNWGDIVPLATSINIDSGVLTLTFREEEKTKAEFDVFSADDGYVKDSIAVSGSISVPLNNITNGQWSGDLKVGYNVNTGFADQGQEAMAKKIDAVEKDLPKHSKMHTFYVAGVPCYVKADVGVYAGAGLKVYGSPLGEDSLGIKANINGGFTGTVEGGVGGSILGEELTYDDHAALEVMAGIYGSVGGKLTASVDSSAGFSLDPEIDGEIGGKITVHIFFLELEDKLTLGRFEWDKYGVEWFFAGESGSVDLTNYRQREAGAVLLGEEEDTWSLLPRRSADTPSLLSDSNILVSNISSAADTAAANVYSSQYGYQYFDYYTNDDLTVEAQQNAMKLYAMVDEKMPVVVDDTPTSDHSPVADRYSVAWVDVAELETASLSDFLMNGEIAVSVYDPAAGTFSGKQILSSLTDEARVYAPAIASAQDYNTGEYITLVTWLQSSGVMASGQLNLVPETTEIWYAVYSGGSWSEPVCAAAVDGEIYSLHANGVSGSAACFYLDYQVEDTVSYVTVAADGTGQEPVEKRSGLRHYAHDDEMFGWMTEAGLFLGSYEDIAATPVLDRVKGTTYANVTSISEGPYFLFGEAYWVCGNEIWCTSTSGKPILIATAEGPVHDLSVSYRRYDGNYLSYLVDTDAGTHLYHHRYQEVNRIEGVYQTAEHVIFNVLCPNGDWWSIDDASGTELMEEYATGDDTGWATVMVSKSDLPESGTLTIRTGTDSKTLELEQQEPDAELVIRDCAWDGQSTLNTYLVTNQHVSGQLNYTLTPYGSDMPVAAWTMTDPYTPELLYYSGMELPEVEEGVYELTVSADNASASALVGCSAAASSVPEVSVEEWNSDTDGTSVSIQDPGEILPENALVYAASYTENRQMLQLYSGELSREASGKWEVLLPADVGENWVLYMMDPKSFRPLCREMTISVSG